MTTNWLTQRERLRELRDAALKREDTPKRAAIPWRFENLGSGFGTIWNGTCQSVTEQSGRYFIAAHSAIPQLLAEVERLEAENKKMRDGYTEHHDITATQMAEVQTACWKAENERDALRAEVERLRSGWREDVTGCVEQVDE